MAQPDPGSWRLADGHRQNAQGLIVSPFAHLPEAVALLLDATNAKPAWLRTLLDGAADGVDITKAIGRDEADAARGADGCAAIAFTATGLRQMGLAEDVLHSFATPFVEGMNEPNRRWRLHDNDLTDPAGLLWAGATPLDLAPGKTPPMIVHAALLLYHATPAELETFAAPLRDLLRQNGVAIVHELSLSLQFDPKMPEIAREHFGFADGISQPIPFGTTIVTKTGKAYPQDPIHGIAAGDLLIGHIAAYGEPSPGPLVPAAAPRADLLPEIKGDAAHRDLGLDGSYLVMRELSQDVPAFDASMQAAAEQIGAPSADWVAERVVGRTKNGVVLAEVPPASVDGVPGNDFKFWATDADGRYCPRGSHIRRANPRDGLGDTAGDAATLLTAANNHRIMRRGRKYASYRAPGRDTPLPGLLFMCLNTDLERQFEFVQQNWLLNCSFAALIGEQDPLVGPYGPFTIPDDPIRLRPTITTFVRLVGGEYFFLPSVKALAYLSGLSTATPAGGAP
jgi:Dyp-type peroxidase family